MMQVRWFRVVLKCVCMHYYKEECSASSILPTNLCWLTKKCHSAVKSVTKLSIGPLLLRTGQHKSIWPNLSTFVPYCWNFRNVSKFLFILFYLIIYNLQFIFRVSIQRNKKMTRFRDAIINWGFGLVKFEMM